MLTWIAENRQEFLLNYTEIGEDATTAEELDDEHRNFEASCMVRKGFQCIRNVHNFVDHVGKQMNLNFCFFVISNKIVTDFVL